MTGNSSDLFSKPFRHSSVLSRAFRLTIWTSVIIVFVISILDLVGWGFNITLFKSIGDQWTPMKIITALCFIFAATALVIIQVKVPAILRKILPGVLATFISLVSLTTLYVYLFSFRTGHESSLTGVSYLTIFISPASRMALLTAFNFLLIGAILFLLSSNKAKARDLAHIVIIPVSMTSYFIIVSYILGVYSVTEMMEVPVALNSGIAFCGICAAVLLISPDTWLIKIFTSRDSGGIFARKLLPTLMILPVVIGWLRINGERTRIFKSEEGVVMVVVTYTFCFLMLVWLTARSVNKIEGSRRASEKALKKSHERLEILKEIASRLLISENPQNIVNELCIRVMKFLECQVFFNYLVDEDAGKLHLNTYAGISDKSAQKLKWLDFGIAVCGSVARDGKRVVAENITNTSNPLTDLISSFGIKAYACHPLTFPDKVIGTLSFGTCSRIAFSEEDLSMMKVVADQVAIAMSHISNENAIRESEERFRKAQEIAHLGSWELNLVNNQLLWSDEVYRIFGLKPQEFSATYQAFLDAIHPDDRLRVDAAYTASLRDGIDTYEIEHKIVRKSSGEIRFVHEKCSHYRDEKGKIVKSVGMVHDITERKKSELAFQESEKKYRLLFDGMAEGFALHEIIADENGKPYDYRFLSINPAFEKHTGLKSENITGKKLSEVLPATEKFWIDTYGKVALTGESIDFENYSSALTAYFKVSAFSPEKGYFAVILENITKRVLAEKELQRTKNYLENLVNYANAPIIVWNPETEIQLFNPAFEHLTGYSSDEVVGKKLNLLFPKASLKESNAKIKHALNNNWVTIEIPILTKNKEIRTVLWNSANIYDSSNKTVISTIAQGNDISERKKAEESLKESEDKLRSVLNATLESIYMFDREGKFTMSNATGFKRFNNITEEKLIGHHFSEFMPAELARLRQTKLDEVFRTGKTVGFEDERNGIMFSHNFFPVFKDKEVSHVVTYSKDITERKRTEIELYRTKNYLENLINYANAPIIVWNPANEIQLFNHAFERLTAYSFTEVAGKKLDFLFPEDSLRLSNKKIKQALTRNLQTIEIPILTKNKEIRTVLWNSANIYDTDNKTILSTIAQGNDITDRIKAELEVRNSKDKLDLALENARIGIWEWDIRTDEFEWDERIEIMFGLKPDSIQKKYNDFELCIYEEDVSHFRRNIQNAIEKDIPFDTIFRIRVNKDEFNYIATKALVEKNNDGKPVKMTGVCFDITEMKKGAEQALFRLNEDLTRSNKELEQFAYVASHDLQEPLRMVSSFTQLLSMRYKDKLDQEAQEFIKFAVDGAFRMQNLINDLLEYSRIETRGKTFSAIDMHNILGQTINNLSIKIKEKNALVINNELPTIIADGGQMVQLFQNLIGNAIKFCNTSPRIHISVNEEQDHYLFTVKDNGIGIEPQYFERIFQIFQRLHSKDEYGGTGIGLAICRRIVERHGGKIWVESIPGEGSQFNFTIRKR